MTLLLCGAGTDTDSNKTYSSDRETITRETIQIPIISAFTEKIFKVWKLCKPRTAPTEDIIIKNLSFYIISWYSPIQ